MNPCVNLPRMKEIFARQTENHVMEIRLNNNIYRHLYFKNPNLFAHWFEIVTFPGVLVYNGYHGCYCFSRINDMFEFFRNQNPNPCYWQEKILDRREGGLIYSGKEVQKHLHEVWQDFCEEHKGIWTKEEKQDYTREFEEEILDKCYCPEEFKALGCTELDSGFFFDPCELDPRIYSEQYLWACCAIPWAIAQFDKAQGAEKND